MKRLAAAAAVLVAAGCGGDLSPRIQLFTASPSAIALGDSAVLTFSVDVATSMSIDQGVGDVTGKKSVTVTPAATTTYTLTASRSDRGNILRSTAQVTVTVGHGAAAEITLAGMPSQVGIESAVPVTLTVRDSFGNPVTDYSGTLHVANTDAAAPAIPDVVLTPAMGGTATIPVTFFTDGNQSIIVSDATNPALTGTATTHVNHGTASAYVLSALPASAVAGTPMVLTIKAVDRRGNLVTDYPGAARVSSADPTDQLPATGGFTSGVRTVSLAFVTAAAHAVTVAEVSGTISANSSSVNVVHAAASRVTLQGLPAQVNVDTPAIVTVTVRDAFGNPVTDYSGTLHFVLTDLAAPPLPDVTFTPAMLGTKDVSVVFFTAGGQSILVSDTVNAALAGSAATQVNHGPAAAYSLSPLPAGAIAGEPLPLTIKATDGHGNLVTNYAAIAHLSSLDPTDLLPADGGFTGGIRTVSLAFVTAGAHAATVIEVAGAMAATTSSVNVVSGDAVQLVLSGSPATAGAAISTTVTAKDTYGNTVASYAGTVTFTSSDSQAALPPAFTFGAADAGQHAFAVTLKTAGAQTVTATDATRPLSGTGQFSIAPAAASACAVGGLPASAAAGAQLGLRVTVQDAFANVATGYTGTMALSSSDPAAQLSAPATFTSTDAGSRVFSAQLRTAGARSVSATDSVNSFACQASVNVVPGAALFAVTFPAGPDAWAGTSVNANVAAQDGFGNAITNFAGTIAFTTSDAAATPSPLPNVTLNGTEGGTTTVPITFNTVGTQSLTATQVGSPATTGAGLQTVHGLVYTAPPAGGKVRLIANASSNASFVQLDLVSNATLVTVRSAAEEASIPNCAATACSRRNGAFGAGLNLPLDVTKVAADATLISTTPPAGSVAVLTLGPAPQAVGALLNTATGVLYSGISQKRAEVSGATTTLRGDAGVSPFPGAAGSGGFYYSLRLRLIPGAVVGAVFDGASLGTKFRAAVRDRSGSDVFSNPDFAIGKLEVR
jgi:hypothetical protein